MVYKTQWTALTDDHIRYTSNPGNPIVQEYRAELDKTGREIIRLVPDGETNLYEQIQSHKASTDLQQIINRYFNGDSAALQRSQAYYGDITAMPTNMHEAVNLMRNAQADFDRLPVDIKEQFGNSWETWVSTLGTQEWADKMKIVKQEVEANESEHTEQ